MGAILSFLVTLLTNLPSRVLLMFGFGFLSFNGYKALVESFIGALSSGVNSFPDVIYSLLSMAGFIQAIGIITAAITAKASLVFLDRLAKLPS